MAICRYQMNFIEEYVLPNAKNYQMLELGDQIFNPFLAQEINYEVAKSYYQSLGYDHTSIDTNGNNGAINHDLTKPKEEFNNKFGIITNHGTSEHIKDQYSLFKNLHDWGCEGCVYVHIVPLHSEEHKKILNKPFPNHGLYEYGTSFWRELSKACNYTLITSTTEVRNPAVKAPINHYSSGSYIKTKDSHFIDKETFNQILKENVNFCF